MFVLRVLIVLLFVSNIYLQKPTPIIDPNTYGPFKVRWGFYDLCSGPKRENLTYITKALLVENEIYKGAMNLTFAANTRIEEIKITVSANKSPNATNVLWNYKLDKPCQHYAIAWVLSTHLSAKNCVVTKGVYNTIVDFTDATYRYLGKSFFYGDFIVKLWMLSKKGNIACFIFNPIFSKI